MTLEEAIGQAINLGARTPEEVVERVRRDHDENWLAQELLGLADDLMSELARKAFGSRRRSAEFALETDATGRSRGELKIARTWIPTVGWKRVADLTKSDLLLRADWYSKLAVASLRRADWCRQVVKMMDREKVQKLSQLKAELPSLPAEDEFEALVA